MWTTKIFLENYESHIPHQRRTHYETKLKHDHESLKRGEYKLEYIMKITLASLP